MRYEIVHDPCADNPREDRYGNLTTILGYHRRYLIGDERLDPDDFDRDWNVLARQIRGKYKPARMWPLYMFDHSSRTFHVGFPAAFRDADPHGWDWMQIGWVFVTRASLLSYFNWKVLNSKREDKLLECAREEVKVYNHWAEGECYGVRIFRDDGEEIDSCYGFYGWDDAESFAKDEMTVYE